MKKASVAIVGCALACGFIAAAAKVEKTMTVWRCQAVDKQGKQCTEQVDQGKVYCWRHRSQKTLNEMADDTAKGASQTWRSAKSWSTNAWDKTCSGAKSAWDATNDAADDARVGIVEMFGGEDAPSKGKGKAK